VLVGVAGQLAGSVHTIHPGDNRMGRSTDCELVMPSVKVSRFHATLISEEGVFAIVALSEKNPTLVNGERCEGAEIEDGDLVQLGDSVFRFRSIEGV
jgi:pSer/pThr/pTyr-binding forkhead associated (FHA) protein